MRKRHLLLLRNLAAHKYQFAALSIIVTLGVAIFISLTVAFSSLGSSYQRTYNELSFADFAVQLRGAPAEVVPEIRRLDNVAGAEGRLIIDTGLILSESEQVHARLIGLPQDRRPAVNNVLVQSGQYWGKAGTGVLAESHFFAFHELEEGDRLNFVTPAGERKLTVLGDAASPEYLITAAGQLDILPSARRFGVFFTPLPELQGLFGAEGTVNDVAVTVRDPEKQGETIAQVESLLEPYGITQTVPQEDQPSNAALRLDLEGAEEFANLLPTLVLIIAALSIFIAVNRLVQGQRQHIGLFMALGYKRRHVVLHYLSYALAVGVIGSGLGVALGLGLASGITGAYAETLGIPLVELEIPIEPILEAVVASLLVAMIAGIGPSWRSARLQPAQAMRLDPQVTLVKGGVPWIERAIRPLVKPSLTMRMPLRAIFRARARTFYTLAGVSFAIVLLLTAAANFDSINYMLDLQYRQAEKWDAVVNFRPTPDDRLLPVVSDLSGVETAEPYLEGFATLTHNGEESDVVVLGTLQNTELHQFQLRPADENLLPNHAVLTPFTSRSTGAETGDEVVLETPAGEQTFTVAGISREAVGAGVYLTFGDAQRAFGMPGLHNGIRIAADTAREDDLKAELYRLPGVENVTFKEGILEDWDELLALFYSLSGVLLIFALIMAFAIVFNTVTVNVLERQRELATMRTIGEERGRLALMMMVENLLIGAAALLPGAALGTAVGYYITQAFSSELFTMLFFISPASYLATAAGVLITVALSVLPAIRRVNRMNLAQASRILT